MGKALTLRGDYSSDLLRSLARASDDADCPLQPNIIPKSNE